jgi:hypothetical protein
MDRKVFLGITLTLAFTTFSLPASSQAVAESVLLGAGSSTAAVKAGSALNSSLNHNSKQLAGRIQQQVSQPRQPNTPQSAKNLLPKSQTASIAVRSGPQPGAMIVSIQGAEPNCSLTNEQTSTRQGNAAAEESPTNCASQNTSVKPKSEKYKSVVTLSFPK